MYRRIEFIQKFQTKKGIEWVKTGLMGAQWPEEVSEEKEDAANDMLNAWCERLKGVGTGKNNRYYFTELGWTEIGRRVIHFAQKAGIKYRIIKIKEKSVDVMAYDKYEVAVRPRKKQSCHAG